MDKFLDVFYSSLNEATATDTLDPAMDTGSDEEAFNASLDKGTAPDAFDTQGLGGDVGGQANYIETAKHWIHEIDQIAEKLNGLDPNSLNSQLNDIDKEGSIFRGVVKDSSDDIVKVTEILKSMAETLKGYIIGASRKQNELDAQRNV